MPSIYPSNGLRAVVALAIIGAGLTLILLTDEDTLGGTLLIGVAAAFGFHLATLVQDMRGQVEHLKRSGDERGRKATAQIEEVKDAVLTKSEEVKTVVEDKSEEVKTVIEDKSEEVKTVVEEKKP